MSYTAPTFVNGTIPALSAPNLNPLVQEVQRLSAASTSNPVSVKDYGAVGDGVADDTAAFTGAVTAAAGRPVFFPAGTYKFTSRITLNDGQEVYGNGGATLTGGPFQLANRNTIRGLRFTGASDYGLTTATTLGTLYDTVVTGCVFESINTGIYLNGTSNDDGPHRFRIVGNRFRNCTYATFAVRAYDCVIADNTSANAAGTGSNFTFFGGSLNTIHGNTTSGGITGIAFVYQLSSAGVSGVVRGNTISGNVIRDCTEEGISLDCRGNTAADIAAVDRGTLSAASTASGEIYLDLTETAFATSGSAFTGMYACMTSGTLAGHAFPIGAHFNARLTLYGVGSVYANFAAGNSLVIGVPLVGNTIVGNTVYGAGTQGISLWGLCYNNVISGNTLYGTGTASAGGLDVVSLNDVVVSSLSKTGASGQAPSMGNMVQGNTLTRTNLRCRMARYGASADYTSVGNRVIGNTVVGGGITYDAHTVTSGYNVASPAASSTGALA